MEGQEEWRCGVVASRDLNEYTQLSGLSFAERVSGNLNEMISFCRSLFLLSIPPPQVLSKRFFAESPPPALHTHLPPASQVWVYYKYENCLAPGDGESGYIWLQNCKCSL